MVGAILLIFIIYVICKGIGALGKKVAYWEMPETKKEKERREQKKQ